jgi:hypothetical protein
MRSPSRAFGLVLLAAGILALSAPQLAAAEEATYSATRSVAVPPSSNFKTGGASGDGWAVTFSKTAVYQIFHHQSYLAVACHLQSSGASCWEPRTITEGAEGFSTSGHSGAYMDEATGDLYVYATRNSDGSGGVVCIDTAEAETNSDPFCGFTPLTPAGQAPQQLGHSLISTPMLVGSRWYAFNYVEGSNVSGSENELLCFDVASDEACAGQPYQLPIGEGTVEEIWPGPASAAIGTKLLIPLRMEGATRIACYDTATSAPCAGSWPALPANTSAAFSGAPYPLLDRAGSTLGFCLPTGTDECFTLGGATTATPAGMSSVITRSDEFNGPAVVLGPRVYVPNGEAEEEVGDIECYDYATDASCANFPKQFSDLDYLYTVQQDPQRPSCLWVNSDNGEQQIQNFDAYTGGACGSGPTRGLATQFVAAGAQCKPISYVSLQVVRPTPGEYATGTVGFADGDGEQIEGIAEQTLGAGGSLDLESLDLGTETGLPQFLFHFTGAGEIGSIEVKLTWRGEYSENCGGEGRTVTRAPSKPSPAKESTSPAAPAATASPPALACTSEQLALVEVARRGSHVQLEGVARGALAGRTVQITLTATGQVVASATVASDGTFSAAAPLPPRAIRDGNAARYVASVASMHSLPLKLNRRMYMSSIARSGSGVQLRGRVTGRFRAGTLVRILMRETCGGEREVGQARLRRNGSFSALVPATIPSSGEAVVYRAATTVMKGHHPFATFTVPKPLQGG